MKTKLTASRVTEMDNIKLEIGELEQFRDFSEITADLYQTKRENVILEAQLGELMEQNNFLASTKAKLDEAVRKETEKKLAEKRALVEAIKAGVLKELAEPKLQDRILKQALIDLQKIPIQSQASV